MQEKKKKKKKKIGVSIYSERWAHTVGPCKKAVFACLATDVK